MLLGFKIGSLESFKPMNRRDFTATSLASLLAPLPSISLAQSPKLDWSGFQAAEINDGRLTTRFGGMATERDPVQDDTLFQVASCSKTVTALAVLTLVRDGRIDLDQPANQYLSRWQLSGPRGTEATVAELMSHTAGTTVQGFGGYGPEDDIPTLTNILSGHYPANSGTVRTRRRIYRKFRYSGGGTMVLQALIEDVAGVKFERYTREEVLIPIGSPQATFQIKPKSTFAFGVHEDGTPLKGGFRRHPESAAAGLWATASDLVRILQAIILALKGNRSAVIPTPLALRMVTPVHSQSGLGIFITPQRVISHNGRNYGFDSVMAAKLDTGRIRAAVTNQNGAIDSYAQSLVPD